MRVSRLIQKKYFGKMIMSHVFHHEFYLGPLVLCQPSRYRCNLEQFLEPLINTAACGELAEVRSFPCIS